MKSGFIVLSALGLLALVTPAQAANAEKTAAAATANKQTMMYDVYAGGIHAVKSQLDVVYENNGRYNIHLGAQTIGFLERLVPWRGTFETKGWSGSEDKPETHRSVATWRGEDDLTEYLYTKDGGFKSLKIVEDSQDKSPKDINPELVKDTTDVLTKSTAQRSTANM